MSRTRTTRWRKVLIAAVLAALVVIVAVSVGCVLVFEASEFILCSKREGSKVRSSDNDYAAQAIERNCGATEPYRVRVVITDRQANRLIPYWFREETVFEAATGLSAIELTWAEENHLIVTYDPVNTERISEMQDDWKGVTIEYVADE